MGPKRYSKETPGHHVQVDVKFLTFNTEKGKIRRFQYTAIDDCTRIRAMKVYEKHNQECAIDFINYVAEKFPFRIHTIQTDNGHEFQSKFNGMSKIKGGIIDILNQENHNTMAKLKDLTSLISENFINFYAMRMM